jgi:hypothetical protein
LKIWPYIIVALAVLSMTSAAAWKLHRWDVARIRAAHAVELADQKAKLAKHCKRQKDLTEGVSREYQKNLADLDRRFNARRLQPSACVPVAVAAGDTGRRDGGAGAGADGRANGIDARSLRTFARDAEAYRLRLKACQAFVAETWRDAQR